MPPTDIILSIFPILTRSILDLITWFACTMVVCLGVFIYRSGHLYKLKMAYPSLWRWGIASIATCGLRNLVDLFSLWINVTIIALIVKSFMAIAMLILAIELWKSRVQLIETGIMLEKVQDYKERKEHKMEVEAEARIEGGQGAE
jgi:hypothetical protein